MNNEKFDYDLWEDLKWLEKTFGHYNPMHPEQEE
jgi:hypothetical protein